MQTRLLLAVLVAAAAVHAAPIRLVPGEVKSVTLTSSESDMYFELGPNQPKGFDVFITHNEQPAGVDGVFQILEEPNVSPSGDPQLPLSRQDGSVSFSMIYCSEEWSYIRNAGNRIYIHFESTLTSTYGKIQILVNVHDPMYTIRPDGVWTDASYTVNSCSKSTSLSFGQGSGGYLNFDVDLAGSDLSFVSGQFSQVALHRGVEDDCDPDQQYTWRMSEWNDDYHTQSVRGYNGASITLSGGPDLGTNPDLSSCADQNVIIRVRGTSSGLGPGGIVAIVFGSIALAGVLLYGACTSYRRRTRLAYAGMGDVYQPLDESADPSAATGPDASRPPPYSSQNKKSLK